MCQYRLAADTMRSSWQAPNGDVAARYLARAFIAFALCFLFLVAVAALFLNEFVYLIAAGGFLVAVGVILMLGYRYIRMPDRKH
jgi:hypothetical protein